MRKANTRGKIFNSLLVVLLLSSLMSLGTNNPQRVNFLVRMASEALHPVQVAARSVGNFFVGSWNFIVDVRNVYVENQQLKAKLEEYTGIEYQLIELRLTNARLRKLLEFKEEMPFDVLSAQVIGRNPSTWFSNVTIDKGSRDGVELDMPVVTDRGVVGRIIEVYPSYSKIMLLISPASGTSAIVQRTRDNGVLVGLHTPAGYMRLTRLPADSDIKEGDVIISSSLTGLYPKGLTIGRVAKVSYDPVTLETSALVKPGVDFERLEEVLVILDFQQEVD